MADNFNYFDRAEQTLYDLIDQSVIKPLLASYKKGVTDFAGYKGKIPAIGIKCVGADPDEDGRIVCSGFCEIVVSGQKDAAIAKAEEIGSVLFGILFTENTRGVTWTYPHNGIKAIGMKEQTGSISTQFVAVIHVEWEIYFSKKMSGSGMAYPSGGGTWAPITGITREITIVDNNNQTHIISFENGVLKTYTPPEV